MATILRSQCRQLVTFFFFFKSLKVVNKKKLKLCFTKVISPIFTAGSATKRYNNSKDFII